VHRSAVTAVQHPGVDMEAKLAFAEFLLTDTDLQASSRRGIDWLAAHSTVQQAVVAVSEPGAGPLLLVAEHGVSSSAIADFSLSREEDGHPLIRALQQPGATYFEAGQIPFRSPIEGASFHAIPLRADEDPVAHGLLLASATGPELHPDVAWMARMLGRQVSRLLSRQTLAETRFGQERMLLYSIINAVTDPILLTDTEGKLIIANTHAEKLFAAPEDASEGWRRAVALNNMLFSAALSTTSTASGRPAAAAARTAPAAGPDSRTRIGNSAATSGVVMPPWDSIMRNSAEQRIRSSCSRRFAR